MPNNDSSERIIPGDLDQVMIVTRYELLKYIRSRRLIGTIAIIALIISLVYVLPPALGSPYSGERVVDLDVMENNLNLSFISDFHSMANFTTKDLVEGTLVFTSNGSQLNSTEWQTIDIGGLGVVFFKENLSGSIVVATYDFKTNSIDFSLFFLNFAEILIIICVTFFGADVLVSEFQNRTAYLLFPNPVKRGVLFFGKFVASFIASISMLGLYYLAMIILSYATIGEAGKYLYLSFGFVTLFLLAALALAYFFGVILKSATAAIILTFLMLFMILPLIEGVGAIAGAKIWFLLTFAAHSLVYSLQFDDYPVDVSFETHGMTINQFYPELGLSAVVLTVYFIICIFASLYFFKRKEVVG